MHDTFSDTQHELRARLVLANPDHGGSDVKVAIVVPAYGQPWLTSETLHTALKQVTDFNYAIVVVNDGCPLPETHDVCQTFAATYPGRIFYLHKKNGGLSAARNSGIEFALAAFADLEAVYFLDCDNRIGPHLLQRLLDALRKSGPHVGWAYPDVNKFGFDEFADTSGPYSPLEHLFRNFCEAGSMVSRRMLDASVRFDTEMRQGVEDWEFWLHGLERGFRGVHVKDAGFGYRRRGESMLVAAERDFIPILRHIRSRHPKLFNIRNVVDYETQAHARYAIYHPDTGTVRCFTEETDVEVITLDTYIVRLLRAGLRPTYGTCPGQLVIMNTSVFETLATQSLLAGLLWTLECGLSRSTFVACAIRSQPNEDLLFSWDKGTIVKEVTDRFRLSPGAIHILAIEASFVAKHASVGGLELYHLQRQNQKRQHAIELDLALRGNPIDLTPIDAAFSRLGRAIAEMRQDSDWVNWMPPNNYRLQTALPSDIYPEHFNLPSVFACGSSERKPCAALVVASIRPESIAIARKCARHLIEAGWEVHLVAFGKDLVLDLTSAECFSKIILLALPQLLSGTVKRSYQDTLIEGFDSIYADDATATLAGYHLAISLDGGASHTLMGAVRRLKVETWALLGFGENNQANNDIVNYCAAFEQAYSQIVVRNTDLLHLCRAFGMPHTKMRYWPDQTIDPGFEALGIGPIFSPGSAAKLKVAV